MIRKIFLGLFNWKIWFGAFWAFIIPFGISRIAKWLRS
jgi:hypothetical protein